MQAVQTDSLELMHFTQGGDESGAVDATWPVFRDTGSTGTAVVYVSIPEGSRLARHTDSAEEVVIVLEGEIEFTISDETGRLGPGGIAVVPAMVSHHAVNVGRGRARFTGVFPSNTVVSTFEEPFDQTGGRVVGTPPPAEATEEAPVAA